METKKLGFLIIGLSIMIGFMMFSFMGNLNVQGQQLHCNPTQECQQVNSLLGLSHVAVGLLSFVFALGFYLLFFNKDEKEILKRYKEELEENNIRTEEKNDKFSLLIRPLDENEKKILTAIKDQKGITQSTLKYRTDLSKAKISQVLKDFEKKNLIERKAKGKTYSVFLTENY